MSERELLERLEKVERSNRRLKRGGLALLVALLVFTTMYATRPIPQIIKAHEFDLVGNTGKVTVAINNQGEGPGISMYDEPHKERISIRLTAWGEPDIHLWGAKGKTGVWLTVFATGNEPAIELFSKPVIGTEQGLKMDVEGQQHEPRIRLSDAQGFEMDIGGTETVTPQTGQTQHASADSIIMFGKDKAHQVIWQAPSASWPCSCAGLSRLASPSI